MFHYAMNLAALLLSGFLRMFGIVYVKVEYAKTAKIKKINIFHQLLEHYWRCVIAWKRVYHDLQGEEEKNWG